MAIESSYLLNTLKWVVSINTDVNTFTPIIAPTVYGINHATKAERDGADATADTTCIFPWATSSTPPTEKGQTIRHCPTKATMRFVRRSSQLNEGRGHPSPEGIQLGAGAQYHIS